MRKLIVIALLTLALQANEYKIFFGKANDLKGTVSLHSCNCVALEGDGKKLMLKVGELHIAYTKTYVYRRVGHTVITNYLVKDEFIFIANKDMTIKQFIQQYKGLFIEYGLLNN